MRCPVAAASVVCSLFLATSAAPAAAAALGGNVVVMPAGAKPIVVPFGPVLCGFDGEAHGFRIAQNKQSLAVPLTSAQATLRVAATAAACAQESELVVAYAYAPWPEAPAEEWVAHVDGGHVEVRGKDLSHAALLWQVGEHVGVDTCHEAEMREGREMCVFAVPSDWPADPALIHLAVVPDGFKLGPELVAFDAKGRKVPLAQSLRHPGKVLVRDFIEADTALDAQSEESRLALRHREAIAQVGCIDAVCEWDQREVLVRALRGNEAALELRVSLKPHVYYAGKNQLQSVVNVNVPLQRCPLSLASAAPFRGASGQKVVLKVGGHCAEDESLRFFVNGASVDVAIRHAAAGSQYMVIQLEAAPGDDLVISLQRHSRVVALLRQPTRQLPNIRARMELAGHGAIDFVPTNREVDLMLPLLGEGSVLVPLPVAGVYAVSNQRTGTARIRGVDGASGWVALRFAVREPDLPGPLAELNLLQMSETVDRALHDISLPVALGVSELGNKPIVELLCSDGYAATQVITPSKPHNLPFRARDSCRLIMHRERLKPEEGAQLFRITVSVADLVGTNRTEAGIDQRIKVSPGPDPRVLYISGVAAPFDRVVARATVITSDLPEAVLAEHYNEELRLPQVQWSVIMGDSRFRLFATTSMPTGLFRVSDAEHSGLMGLSAGVLMRLVYLTRTGTQLPIGVEAGAFIVGITGDSTPAPHGQAAGVFGLSLSVPIANVSRMTQAAINLHAWAEYEVSRRYIAGAGNPWGFIFGPSLSFGDVGWNL